MNFPFVQFLRSPRLSVVKEFGFLLRGVLMTGRRYRCPVCEWSTRSFVGERKFLQKSDTGYCPRCNAKARHRRIWLYLSEHTEIFTDRVRLVEVAPWWSFARRFRKIATIEYLGVDLKKAGPQVSALGDLASSGVSGA